MLADSRYIPALDGIRAISILLVVLAHLGLDQVLPGGFGVTLFFFISGLLITRQLAGGLARQGGIDFAGFYLRRCLRLLPAAVVFTLVAGCVFVLAGGRITLGGWLAALLWGANWYELAWHYQSSLVGVRHPFNILWSLAIEDHFYLIWPLTLWALWSRGGGEQRRVLLALGLICVAVPLWRWWLFTHCGLIDRAAACLPLDATPAHRWARLYRGTDARADSIAWGALLALLPRLEARLAAARWLPALGVAGLVLSLALRGEMFHEVIRYTLQGASLLLLMPALITPRRAAAHALSWLPAVFIGRLSYSLYLWHWAALMIADRVAPTNHAAWLATAVVLSAGLSCCSFYCIERPMLRLRRRAGSHAPATLGWREGRAQEGQGSALDPLGAAPPDPRPLGV